MTSDQTCPLCGEEREVYNILGHPRYKCHNIDCILCGKEILYQTNKQYQSQIARIRQEAKQELINEIESRMGIVIIINKKKGVE